jgi:hypothetical protein
LTMAGLPVWATHPATPSPSSPGRRRRPSPWRPRASSKASSCFSSSTMSIGPGLGGMSCWILAMISSITLRGSRMEFAVLTMSVRMAGAWWSASGRGQVAAAGRRTLLLPRPQVGLTAAGAGSPGRQASTAKSNPRLRARRSAGGSGRDEEDPHGRRPATLRSERAARGGQRAPFLRADPRNASRARRQVAPSRGSDRRARLARSARCRDFWPRTPTTTAAAISRAHHVRRCSVAAPFVPTARPPPPAAGARLRNSLKEPSGRTSIDWPFTVRVAPAGSVPSPARRCPWGSAAPGRAGVGAFGRPWAIVKREVSEKQPAVRPCPPRPLASSGPEVQAAQLHGEGCQFLSSTSGLLIAEVVPTTT